MRRFLLATAALALFATPAVASASTDTMKACDAGWKAMSPADQEKTTFKAYSAACIKEHGRSQTESMAHQQQMMGAMHANHMASHVIASH